MSRTELYPWSMLTEVGDYFVVPASFKPSGYVCQLVAQRNYKGGYGIKLSATKLSYGTIVMVVQVRDEVAPHDYISPEGILSITGKQYLRSQDHTTPLGERPQVAKRTVSQIVALMPIEQREANLPWWYDKKGQLIFNSKIATQADLERWYNKEKMPGKDEPYPAYYNLDENLIKRDEPDDEVDEEEFFEVLETEGGANDD